MNCEAMPELYALPPELLRRVVDTGTTQTATGMLNFVTDDIWRADAVRDTYNQG